MPDETISFYFNALFISGWALASPARIQYADLADIVKMLDSKTGGAHQDPVNAAQSLVRPPQ